MEKVNRKRRTKIPSDEVITLEHVSKAYESGYNAVNDVTLHIKRGEFVFIIGGNGSGKSTLIKLIMRELAADEGEITVLGYNLRRIRHNKIPKFRRNLGIVFQDFRLLKDRNVYENVAFAQRIIQAPTREIRRNVPNILAMVGLPGKYKNKINQLSGGEQQRVAMARALVNRPTILLADEPTGNLDPKTSEEIMQLLDKINQNGTTVIVVTHNREVVDAMRKRVITMKKGVVVYDEENGMYRDED